MTRGSIWWTEFDPAKGSEIKKLRPAVIVSADDANCRLARVVVVPLTSNTSRVYPAETLVTINGVMSKAMTDQIRAVDKTRLKRPLGYLSSSDMCFLETTLRLYLALE